MIFGWFDDKAGKNLEKHGVTFEEAQTIFYDPDQYGWFDRGHSKGERRYICLGLSAQGRLLTVVYTEQEADSIWIISARMATSREEEIYARRDQNS